MPCTITSVSTPSGWWRRSSPHDALDEAVAKLNDEIGQREPSLFFDLYKTHLAQQAVQDVPEATQAVFPAEFLAPYRATRPQASPDPARGYSEDRHLFPAKAP